MAVTREIAYQQMVQGGAASWSSAACLVDPAFEVVYVGGKVIRFENVDTFPADADIARIALEIP